MKKWLLPLMMISMACSVQAIAEDVYTWKPDAEKRFNAKDLNHDGTITKEEFMHPYNTNFTRIDSNGDGQISIEEMRQYMSTKRPKHVTVEQWNVKADHHFDRKDINKDNIISFEEFMSRYEDSFRGYDRDNNEMISLEEMRIYWEAEKAELEKAKAGEDD